MAADLGWNIIAPNRLKIRRSSRKGLDDPVVLGDCPRTRLRLLVPGSEGVQDRRVRVSDVVPFVFRDAAVPRLGIWKLGRVVESVSERTGKIMYTLAGRPRSTSLVPFDS